MRKLGWILALTAGAAGAHEIGTTRVAVLIEDSRTYRIEITADAQNLAEKLNPDPRHSPSHLQSFLSAADERFRRRVRIAFDGVEARPEIAYAVAAAADALAAPVATIRLSGRVPAGAHSFTWNYGWTFASYAMLVRRQAAEDPATQWLEGGQTSAPYQVAASKPMPDRLRTGWRYLKLGFTHILPYGLDHMLFVLGIYLLSRRAKSVLMQVSAFTVAHSITLGLSMYGLVSVSPRIVEPLIAISIAYVAIENLFLAELKSWRVALVFAFGLLHGMGFAGALRELGLPRSEFLTALVTFNLGVEGGQLAVIAAAFLVVGWHYSQRAWYRSRVVVPASLAIAVTAVYWTIERL